MTVLYEHAYQYFMYYASNDFM